MEFTGERFTPSLDDKQLETEHLQRYYSITELVKGKVVLDAACGEGYGAFYIAQYAKTVYGIDIDHDTIFHANQKYGKANLHYKQGSVEKLEIPECSIDVVISFETIEHVDESQQHTFLKEIKRVLKKDGIVIISTPDKYLYSDLPRYDNPFHIKEFYKDEFRDFLEGYFANVKMYFQRFEVVSLLGNEMCESFDDIQINDGERLNKGKYMVAVCGDLDISDVEIHSLVLDNGIHYQDLISRVIGLQDEVEERNSHISKLDEFIESKEKQTAQLNELLLSEQANNHNLRNYLNVAEAELEETNAKFVTMENDFKEIANHKDIVINNQLGHINQLLEQERRLVTILNSSGWKGLNKYYRFRDAILPQSSKRKLVAKLLLKTIKNPRKMFGMVNSANIKKFMYYSRTDKTALLQNRIDNYLDRQQSQPKQEFTITKIDDTSKKLIFPKTDNPTISIIIPVYNQWSYTYSCLASILENTDGVSYEIIIADDLSTDETQNIQSVVENIVVIRDDVNRGFLLNCNHAATFAKGKYVYFLNNDTNVQPNWLSSLLDMIEKDETIGMIGSKLVYPDGRLQEAGGIIWSDSSGWNYGRLDDPAHSDYNYVKEVDYISGAAIMIRSQLWKELGGFDERFVPAYYEDTDLAFEVRKLGYKVVLQPQSVVIHFEGISHGTDTNAGIKSYQIKNKEKFVEKWKDTLQNEHFENATDVFWARDRSSKKKTIVVVDHYVPHYDKDAGGRCVYQYLTLFVEMGYHVIFIGDNFFKHEPYTSQLEQLGIQVLYGNWYAKHIDDWVKQNQKYIDYVYLNRPHISIKYIDLFKNHTNAKVVYFGHDLHYVRERRNYEIDNNPEFLKSADKWKKMEFELFRKSDVIYVVGNYEQELVKREFPHKEVRNIPLYLYDHNHFSSEQLSDFEERKDLLFVGGFGHKPNQDGVLWFVKSVWPKIYEERKDVKLFIVGSNPPSEIKELSSDRIIVTGFVSDEELEKYYKQCRVVVVPLRFGAGVKGKVVEAMANGLPLITTSIGAEGLQEVESVVRIADDEQKFGDEVLSLYTNRDMWEEISRKSFEYIEDNFSKASAKELIKEDFGKKG
ncbi:glycosyltransferase [Paenibacillus contaminans]|uniref:Glycosyl transferase family 2 n=1 Tax=Paenibacillus contaminans TaxID=450362 RepID=A0A329M5B1_9BACL|nr:glycosyltransferase [Paenibacillus contaminans]RAV13793.1 glycosyl transferase family 2 [Paenibacillus contaminans]